MAKSKRKSGSSTDASRWETELAQAHFAEDDWKTVVVFAIPNQVDDVKHCSALTESISTGLRKLFSVIEYDTLIKEVKDLAHGKGGKGKNAKPPPFVEIVDSIKSLVEQGEEIPPAMLAKLIKFKMLMIKQKDFDRREEQRKAAEAAAKQAKQEERSRSKTGSSPGKRSKSQSPGRKKGKRDDGQSSPKKDTKLKRRGELEETFKTIDDEPDGKDDPQQYIVITSVYEPRVFQPLIDLGVVIDAVLNVKSESYIPKEVVQIDTEESLQELNVDAKEVENEEDKRNLESLQGKIEKFWNSVDKVILDSPSGTKIKDVATLPVVIKDSVVPEEDLKDVDQDKKTEYGTKLFDTVANACYALLDAKKRYNRYIDNLKLTHVPSVQETIQTCKADALAASVASTGDETFTSDKQKAIPDIDLRYYNHIMNQVPCEAHSVPLLLDSLLQQVEATVDHKDMTESPPPPRVDKLDNILGDYIDDKLQKLGLMSPAAEGKPEKDKAREPVILHHGDETSLRTHHLNELEGVVPQDAEHRVYDCHHLKSLMLNHSATSHDEDINDQRWMLTRKQQLSHFCNANENQTKFDKLLALMSLEVLPLQHVGVDGEVGSPYEEEIQTHLGWDDPYTLESSIDESEILRNLSQYQFSEYFDAKTLPQVLDQAMEIRPYVDMYYHCGLSDLLLVLHNPRDDQLMSRKSWSTWLHSNVGFKNYLDHIADEVELWQREEDTKEEIRNRPVTPQEPLQEPTPIPIKAENRNKMITRAELLEMKDAEEDKNKKKSRKTKSGSKSPGRRPNSDSKKVNSPDKREKTGSSRKRTPPTKKPGSRAGTARKNVKSSQEKNSDQSEPPETENIDESAKEYPFRGYDVGDALLHVSGETSYLFPRDGSLIRVDTCEYVNGDKTHRTTVYNDENALVICVKNPISKPDELVKSSESDEVVKEDASIQVLDEEQEAGEEESNKFIDLLSTIPAIPDVPEPKSERSHLTINFKDGMRVGLEAHTSQRLRQQLDAVVESVQSVKDSVKNFNEAGGTASTLNAKAASPKGRRNKEEELRRQEELEKQMEKETLEKIEAAIKDVSNARRACLRSRNLSVSCPDGLLATFTHDEVSERRVLRVRQEYILKSSGKHPCEEARLRVVTEEQARVITMDGTVIKYMMDGSVTVLFPDGSVCSSPLLASQRSTSGESRPSENVDTGGLASADTSSTLKKPGSVLTARPLSELSSKGNPEWYLVNAAGERYHRTVNSEESRLSDIIISKATCPRTNQILETREDGVIRVNRPDHSVVVEHTDGTRITTHYVDISQATDKETGEEEIRRHEPMEYIKVECVGYATVLLNRGKDEIKTLFGNGSVVHASLDGEYKVERPDSTRVFVSQKGETIFAPIGASSDFASHEVGNLMPLFEHIEQNGVPPGIHLLKLADANCLSTIDHCGNEFNVSSAGGSSTNCDSGTTEPDDENLSPRYFIVHKDGSAEELLREGDFSKFIDDARKDPLAAVMKSADGKESGYAGTTILRPFKGTKGDQWLGQKDEGDIIPSDLRERDFKTLPSTERNTSGPKFGTNAGIAFQVATKPAPSQPKPLIHCPKVLEMRHIVQFGSLDTEERRRMIEGIEKYRKFVIEQYEKEVGLLSIDPRSDAEKEKATELFEKFQQIEAQSQALSKPSVDTVKVADDYLEATKVPSPPPPEKAKPQRPLKEWEKDRIEIAELKYAKEYLRSGVVPAYFDTVEGQNFLNSKNSPTDDIERVAADLAKETVHPLCRPASASTTDTNGDLPNVSNLSNPSGEFYDLRKSDQPLDSKNSFFNDPFTASPRLSLLDIQSSLSRPGNPTPAEAVNGDSGLGIHRDVPSRTRPYNPTPHHALKNSSGTFGLSFQGSLHNVIETNSHTNITVSDKGMNDEERQLPPIENDDRVTAQDKMVPQAGNNGFSPRFTGLNYTVTGEPRTDVVNLPASIQGSRPGALPNQKFMDVEEPVRRQVKTASVAGAVKPESTSQLRGFLLLPDTVDFGILKEGMSYSQTVMLKNVGIDTCRFKIKQPPPSTGLRVLYNPGPVAAGMAARLDVEIFAVAVGVEGAAGVGSVGHHIEILTETDALYLPVVATIMTAHEFDNRSYASPRGGPTKNTLLLSGRPSSRDALTRLRKV